MRYMVDLQQHTLVGSTFRLFAWIVTLVLSAMASAEPLDHIRVSDDKTHFVHGESAERFIVWGVNYDHDRAGRLLDEYWIDEWPTVVEDFGEIKALGANCVRIHLQLGKFLDTPDTPNVAALAQLEKLVQLAEDEGLYLDVTGLACYHKKNIVIEEMFPLSCSESELIEFVRKSSDITDGWISFYRGAPVEQLRAAKPPTLAEAITASWLDKFQQISKDAKAGQLLETE